MSGFAPLIKKPLTTSSSPATKAAAPQRRSPLDRKRRHGAPAPACFDFPIRRTAESNEQRAQVVQAKLEVSAPGDALELEADRVAEHVMRPPSPRYETVSSNVVLRECDRCAKDDEPHVVLRAASTASSFPVGVETPPGFDASLASARQVGGEGLPSPVRGFMEPRFGEDFGGVRIHRDAHATQLTREVGAKAFTVGRDVFFRQGAFEPATHAGRRLIAHELAHVVQQGGLPTKGLLQRVPTESGVSATPPRYSFSTHCGWIDWSHATPTMAQSVIDAVQAASDRVQAQSGATPTPEIATPSVSMRSSAPILGTLSAVTPSVEIKRVLSSSEVQSVAFTLFQYTSLGFEMQQQTTELLGHSSFSQEDLPSNVLGFYRAALRMDRAGVASTCDVWSPERSAERFNGETFAPNRSFRPPTSAAGGSWPAIFNSIRPAVAGGPLMGVPSAVIESMLSRVQRSLGFFSPRLSIGPVGATAPFDLSDTEPGANHGPNFEVGPVELTTDVQYRWSLRDENDNAFAMWGADGHQVHGFSSQRVAYIPSRTRTLLRERNIRSGVVLCRIKLTGADSANETRLLRLPVTFR
jgi:hypothetical protein